MVAVPPYRLAIPRHVFKASVGVKRSSRRIGSVRPSCAAGRGQAVHLFVRERGEGGGQNGRERAMAQQGQPDFGELPDSAAQFAAGVRAGRR
jgi:hypothetical protein